MKIAIVTDAWEPQVNGVVRTLGKTRDELVHAGHEVRVLTPAARTLVPTEKIRERLLRRGHENVVV